MTSIGDGNLYGTTSFGGRCPIQTDGCGTVFKLSPPASAGGAWKEVVLHSFQGGVDGIGPLAAVVGDGLGNLYGTTTFGGMSGMGTVFEVFKTVNGLLSPPEAPWPETVVYPFTGGSDGGQPRTALTFNRLDHTLLYGTTSSGGAASGGTVFSLYNPPAPPIVHQCSGTTYWCQRLDQCLPLSLIKDECLFVPVRPSGQ
jgi:uncharacterized repeat protein (TIGR03803 family)